ESRVGSYFPLSPTRPSTTTLPHTHHHRRSTPIAAFIDNMASSPGDAMYAIQDIPGKGKGLIATRDIAGGTRILGEVPLHLFRHFEMALGLTDIDAFLSFIASCVEA